MNFYTNIQILGNDILFRGVINGRRKAGRFKYSPSLFVPTTKTTQYNSLDGRYLGNMDFSSISEAREFINKYKDVDNFEIFGNQNFEYAYICQTFRGKIQWDISKILIANLDIEVGSENGFPNIKNANEPITAITIKLNDNIYAFGCDDFIAPDNVNYTKCDDEYDLINQFISLWTSNYPDLITGWNVNLFDIVYLVNRIKKLFGEEVVKKLSPWKQIRTRTVTIMGKENDAYEIFGIAVLDYYDLYKKFAPESNRESYKLDYICHVELGEKKLSYEEYGSLHNLYKENFQKFMEYNIRDVMLIDMLEKKLKLLKLALNLAYNSKTNYIDVFRQTRMWDSITYNFLDAKNIVIPPKVIGSKEQDFIGAAVKDPIPGLFRWVVSGDFTSLYPHLQMGWNLSTETILEPDEYPFDIKQMLKQEITVDTLLHKKVDLSALKKHNLAITPNKQVFRRDFQGFMPEIIEGMFNERKLYKNKMLDLEKKVELEKDTLSETEKKEIDNQISECDIMQRNIKVCLNSSFGAQGNPGFRFYDIRQAEAITLSGQLAILWVQKHVNEYLNKLMETENVDYIIASDTDSVYITLDALVNKVFGGNLPETTKVVDFIDKVCQTKLMPYIDKVCKDLCNYTNAYDITKLNMKREKICDVGVVLSAKHYIWNVWDSEGVRYEKPKIKVVGLEIVKSSTPEIIRQKLKDALPFILTGDKSKLYEYVDAFREEFDKLPIEDISFPRGMNGLGKYKGVGGELYKKGTPIHVKGSLIYNKLLKDKELTKKYQEIQEGEKLKFAYLKTPNPIFEESIAFPLIFPCEFGLNDYIDRDMQFEKGFIAPLKTILDAVGWDLQATSSLEDFF